MTFEPNQRGLDEMAQQISAKLQQTVDAVYEAHANEPADQVASALRSALEGIGVTFDASVIDTMAGHISAGRHVDTTPH